MRCAATSASRRPALAVARPLLVALVEALAGGCQGSAEPTEPADAALVSGAAGDGGVADSPTGDAQGGSGEDAGIVPDTAPDARKGELDGPEGDIHWTTDAVGADMADSDGLGAADQDGVDGDLAADDEESADGSAAETTSADGGDAVAAGMDGGTDAGGADGADDVEGADADAGDAVADTASPSDAADAGPASDAPPGWPDGMDGGFDGWPSELDGMSFADLPKHIDLDATVAPADAALSPYKAQGGFVWMAGGTPQPPMAADQGGPLTPPTGSVPMAIDADDDGLLDLLWLDGKTQLLWQRQTSPWAWQTQPLATTKAKLTALAAIEVDGDPTPELVAVGDTSVFLDRAADGTWLSQATARNLPKEWGFSTAQGVLPGDVDDDGLLDLLVSRFHCGNEGKPALTVLRQRGDGTFLDTTSSLGLHVVGDAWGTAQADIDDDGDLDILVLAESCSGAKGSWALRHRPIGSLPMYEPVTWTAAFQAPLQVSGSPMGLGGGDLNHDGVQDWVLGEIELSSCKLPGCLTPPLQPWEWPIAATNVSTVLLLSQPGGGHASVGLQAGLWQPGNADGKPMTGWSPALVDFDHDGFLDILLSHGYEYGEWIKQDITAPRPVAWRNDGTQHFYDISKTWTLPLQHPGRAMALADLDGDGDLDLALGAQGQQPMVMRNNILHGGADLHIRLRGALSNPWGLGARVQVQTNQRAMVAWMSVQAWSQTMATPVITLSLRPNEAAKTALVRWPSGAVISYPLSPKGAITLQEPSLFTLSKRHVKPGAPPVVLTLLHVDGAGKAVAGAAACTVEQLGGTDGSFDGPLSCQGAVCVRTWSPGAQSKSGDFAVFIGGCGGKTWAIRPRIDIL